MLRMSTPDTTSEDTVPGATDVIEAASAEEAIAEVHDRLGADARILEARRVLRGGIGGFFARQVVQLHAAPGTRAADVDAAVPREAVDRAASVDAGMHTAAVPPVDRLLAGIDDAPESMDFATYLRHQLEGSAQQSPATTDTSPAVAAPAPSLAPSLPPPPRQGPPVGVPAAPAGTIAAPAPTALSAMTPEASAPCVADQASAGLLPADDPAWSTGVLAGLGLPVELVRSLAALDPQDDLGWTVAVARALVPSCRPLPAGPAVVIGPRAAELGRVSDAVPARSALWRGALRDGRWCHLVVGGEGWRSHLADEPLAVSWASPDDLPDALRCAVELGLVLGYGPLGGRIRRARPLDVALAIRALVEDRA